MVRSRWSIAVAFVACVIMLPALPDGEVIQATVHSTYTYNVTVSVDGVFKCQVAAGSDCVFQIARGQHLFGYETADNRVVSDQNEVPAEYGELCIYLDEKGVTYDDCDWP